MQNCFVSMLRVEQCDAICLWAWAPESVFPFLSSTEECCWNEKTSFPAHKQNQWRRKIKKIKKYNNNKKKLLLNVVCTILTQLGGGWLFWLHPVFPEHLFISQVMLTMLLSFWWVQSTWAKGELVSASKDIGCSQWLNHWVGFFVDLCEEWRLCLAFLMTFSVFSQAAVNKCPFPKELPVCRLVIVILSQPWKHVV